MFGGGLDRRVAPIIPVSFTYSASFSTFWVYVGIYAVKGLHWPASRVGLLFLASPPAAAVATNLGTLVGPPLGALLVFVAGWTAFLLGISALGVVGAAFAITLLPPAHAIVEAREAGSLRTVLRDRPFSLLLLSTLLAFTDY